MDSIALMALAMLYAKHWLIESKRSMIVGVADTAYRLVWAFSHGWATFVVMMFFSPMWYAGVAAIVNVATSYYLGWLSASLVDGSIISVGEDHESGYDYVRIDHQGRYHMLTSAEYFASMALYALMVYVGRSI